MKTSDVRREREVRRREGYREIILHAAEKVILRKGYSSLTMDDVAREAQLSKATIYKYVPGKGALLFEILGHFFDDIRVGLVKIADGPGSAADKLGRVVQAVLQSGEDTKHFNRVLWMDKAMFKLMRLFVHPPGKAGSAPAADRKMLAMLRQKRQELIDVAARILSDGIAVRRIPAHGHRARPRPSSKPCSRAMPTRSSGKGDAPLRPVAAESLTRFIIEGIRNPEHSGKEI